MSDNVMRIFVEKKSEFAIEADNHLNSLKEDLQIDALNDLRLFNRYDIEGIDKSTFDLAKDTIFSEPQVDVTYLELPKLDVNHRILAIEFLPGQYDQRADSCQQCIQILTQKERPIVKTARVFVLIGDLSDNEFEKIKNYLINPVESREASLSKPDTLVVNYDIPTTVDIVDKFIDKTQSELSEVIDQYGLAMDLDDIIFCQNYFKETEKRNPTITEVKMIDTYWSDHCRHTTFSTKITDVKISDDYIEEIYKGYLKNREKINIKKDICLMDMATIGMKVLKRAGKLKNLDESEEINACSVEITVDVDKEKQQWLLMFKNETHNHPTEIEPFGGAATCLGGAIRDPLSGRSYVYQAMRVTGCADPRIPVSETMEGKLPQRKISTTAAAGYSSYGNQIGLATGLVNEIYHPNYVAKHMEIGMVMGAAPKSHVNRQAPIEGDIIILLGGRTGRDGCGGATGSSKAHTLESLESCGAEVQKGNPLEERKIQRLFRDGEVTRLIKRCNDFGAGGVSVAIGELADSLMIDLNAVPKKYEGLDGTELAISESQERMAVVVSKDDVDRFLEFAKKENLEATIVAKVTSDNRLKMVWNDNTIVDISREFLNSNGATKKTKVEVPSVDLAKIELEYKVEGRTLKEKLNKMVTDLNICSQRGMGERFDSTIGAGTINMPYGGIYQMTKSQFMSAKIPVLNGETNTASVASYGFNPFVSSVSPFHSAIYSIIESLSYIAASGSSIKTAYLTLQEYFAKTKDDPKRWGSPFSAILGALYAQINMEVAAIGGKDSMSGTFMDIDVPPTLVSFAVSTNKANKIVTNDFKGIGNTVILVNAKYDDKKLPDFNDLKKKYDIIYKLAQKGKIISAYGIGFGGIAEGIIKACFGNMAGFELDNSFDKNRLFERRYGSLILEVENPAEIPSELEFENLGHIISTPVIKTGMDLISLDMLLAAWECVLEDISPVNADQALFEIPEVNFEKRDKIKPVIKVSKPKVLIPVFPGTNCEYDTMRQFEKAGADVDVFVIKNLNSQMIEESITQLKNKINDSQILMLPGGFSGGDEPDGSGKFIATVFRNPYINDAVMELLNKRDGLALGICNGFQALVKLGLLPYGEIRNMDENCPTLTFNQIGRHQSRYVRTKVVSVKSPWLSGVKLGDVHAIPISHGEGRFFANEEVLKELIDNGQIATQYVDFNCEATYDIRFNPNNSILAIEGITSKDGRILGKMAHSERMGKDIGKNIFGEKDQKIFKSGVNYFKL